MNAGRIAFIAVVIHTILALINLWGGTELFFAAQKLRLANAEVYLVNWPFLNFAVFACVNTVYAGYLRKAATERGWFLAMSVLLFIAPFVTGHLLGMYFTLRAMETIQENIR